MYDLHRACKRGSLKKVQALVKKKFDVNQKNNQGDTPMMVALRYRMMHLVEYLYDTCYAEFTKEDITSLFKIVATKSDFEMVQIMFTYSVCSEEDDPSILNHFIQECISLNNDLLPDLLNYKSSPGYSMIHQTCIYGFLEIMRVLLNTGYVDMNIQTDNNDQTTPLFLALCEKKYNIVEYLIKSGADCSIYTNDEDFGVINSFELACIIENNYRVIKLMILHNSTLDLNSGLDKALEHKNWKTAGFLLRKGAKTPHVEMYSDFLKSKTRVCDVCMKNGYTWKNAENACKHIIVLKSVNAKDGKKGTN